MSNPPALTLSLSKDEGAATHGIAQQGFTLVELMVVLVLIGLAASVVMLAARGPDAAAGDEAARLALRIAGARDRAIVDGRSTRVEFVADGYRFAQRSGGEWVTVTDRGLRATTLPSGVTLGASRAMLGFDSGGLPDAPVDVVLRADEARVTVRVDAAGGVDVVR
ncbi:GspH/FimT family pseudopilin [Sphingomonas aestuarii]